MPKEGYNCIVFVFPNIHRYVYINQVIKFPFSTIYVYERVYDQNSLDLILK